MTAIISLMLTMAAAIAWFMAVVAGSYVGHPNADSAAAKMWWVCSSIAVIFLPTFAFFVGRTIN